MKVEAIIIDGKKYVPCEEKSCNMCAFGNMNCISDYSVTLCSLFHCGSLREVEENLHKSERLEQMPVQVEYCTVPIKKVYDAYMFARVNRSEEKDPNKMDMYNSQVKMLERIFGYDFFKDFNDYGLR